MKKLLLISVLVVLLSCRNYIDDNFSVVKNYEFKDLELYQVIKLNSNGEFKASTSFGFSQYGPSSGTWKKIDNKIVLQSRASKSMSRFSINGIQNLTISQDSLRLIINVMDPDCDTKGLNFISYGKNENYYYTEGGSNKEIIDLYNDSIHYISFEVDTVFKVNSDINQITIDFIPFGYPYLDSVVFIDLNTSLFRVDKLWYYRARGK
ncbi:MAG: hypothetical protein ACPGSD_08480 [Flavobacteriales bacterium]